MIIARPFSNVFGKCGNDINSEYPTVGANLFRKETSEKSGSGTDVCNSVALLDANGGDDRVASGKYFSALSFKSAGPFVNLL